MPCMEEDIVLALVCDILSVGSVLVSAGIDLIFFLVAGTVLCFGSSVRIMLIDNTLMF